MYNLIKIVEKVLRSVALRRAKHKAEATPNDRAHAKQRDEMIRTLRAALTQIGIPRVAVRVKPEHVELSLSDAQLAHRGAELTAPGP